jgi:hypothetical protein
MNSPAISGARQEVGAVSENELRGYNNDHQKLRYLPESALQVLGSREWRKHMIREREAYEKSRVE